jgi:hypothetical protein
MTPLSPLDALGPAFRRTREVLADPFRLGFFLKIALIAALTQPSFYSASLSYPIQGANFLFVLGHPRRGFGTNFPSYGSQFMAGSGVAALGISVIVVLVVIGLALWVLLAYLYCRLRFTLFDLIVYKRGVVGRAWAAYGRQSWRYFGLVMLVSLAFLVIATLIIGPAMLNFIRIVRPLATAGPNANPFPMLGAMLPFLAAIFAVAALWAIVDALMQDFLLPPMAIEDAPLESAFGPFFALLRANAGSVVIYILLRFAVGIGLTWILMLVLLAGLFIAGLAIYGVGMLLYHALWASMVGQVICVALAILVGLVVVLIYALAIISIYGIAAVFKQSYAAYFFGGRYAALGERLEPPPAAAIIEASEPPALPPSPPPGAPPLEEAPPVW